MPDPEIFAILQALERYSGKYEQEAVDAAIAHREEIVPILIENLEKVADNPTRYLEDMEYYLYIYGVMLLGHLRETRAHPAIVRVFSLPDPVVDKLFGDIQTENLASILHNTCGGNFDLIKSMVLNRRVGAYARGEAARALAYAAVAGELPREEVLNFFSTLFTGDEAGKGSPFWGLIADCILDLHPAELMPVLREADEKGLLEGELFLTEEDFSQALAGSVEQSLATVRREMELRSLEDLHGEMSRWSNFSNEEPEPWLPPPDSTPKKSKKEKKSKKKMAKASKRKNRR